MGKKAPPMDMGPSLEPPIVTVLEMVCGLALTNIRAGSRKGKKPGLLGKAASWDGKGRRKRKQIHSFLPSLFTVSEQHV